MSSTRPGAQLPLYSFDLIEDLDKLFPTRCIGENESPESAHRYAGKRDLVEYLLALKNRGDPKTR